MKAFTDRFGSYTVFRCLRSVRDLISSRLSFCARKLVVGQIRKGEGGKRSLDVYGRWRNGRKRNHREKIISDNEGKKKRKIQGVKEGRKKGVLEWKVNGEKGRREIERGGREMGEKKSAEKKRQGEGGKGWTSINKEGKGNSGEGRKGKG